MKSVFVLCTGRGGVEVAPGLAVHQAEPTHQILIHLDTQAFQKEEGRGGAFFPLLPCGSYIHTSDVSNFFCSSLSPSLLRLLRGKRKPPDAVQGGEPGIQGLGVDEERLITITPKAVGGGDVDFVL
jgi:hypothetical protein